MASVAVALGIALGLIGAAHAQPADGNRPSRPPAEALAACTSATSGQTCSFTLADSKKLTGTCGAPEQGVPLACHSAEATAPGRAASAPSR